MASPFYHQDLVVPSFIRFIGRAALAVIIPYWAPGTGCSVDKLLVLAARALSRRRCGWQVFSLRRDCLVDAYEHWFWLGLRPGTANVDAAYLEDLAFSASEVERLAAALNLPPPFWLAEWRGFITAATATAAIATATASVASTSREPSRREKGDPKNGARIRAMYTQFSREEQRRSGMHLYPLFWDLVKPNRLPEEVPAGFSPDTIERELRDVKDR